MRTNVVLIDFENVRPDSLTALVGAHFKLMVFVGANQVKLTVEFAMAVHQMGDKAEYVKISGNGPNALDFHIAFYIGQLAARDPTADFHIISKDTGYDPLIEHLLSRHVRVRRHNDFTTLTFAASLLPAIS